MKTLIITLRESGLPQYEPPEYEFEWHGEAITMPVDKRLAFLTKALAQYVEEITRAYRKD